MLPELQHKVLRQLQDNPNISQRDLAEILGISLGRTNYCLQALVEKGFVKARNFKNNKNKLSYAYLLTPQGIQEKAKLTMKFYEIKKKEFEDIKAELEKMQSEEESISMQYTEHPELPLFKKA
ncbi:MAG: MarR family EPS-associated transcriptional regulator [Leptospira sp.]|nr:MarR family EPS-associated transcriptional regulator [Leptospira sp.]